MMVGGVVVILLGSLTEVVIGLAIVAVGFILTRYGERGED
jgi:hypothetical protein